jgi:ribonuclease T2
MLRGVAAALIFACAATWTAAAQQRGEPGRFDFYVLALSWSPSYCEAEGDRRHGDEQCRRGRPYAFVVHGLWPQYDRGYPRACVDPAPRIPNSMIDAVRDLMPARGLVIHQWRTHGTCSGLDGEDYFAKLRAARERVVIPESYRRVSKFMMVAPDDVEEAFLAANSGLEAEMIAVTCDTRRLREVRICMNRDLTFRACPETDRRGCRMPRIVMPPVRD